MNKQPLKTEIADGRLVISIGLDTLAFAANHMPDPPLKVTDEAKFAESIATVIVWDELAEEMLDKAVLAVVEGARPGAELIEDDCHSQGTKP